MDYKRLWGDRAGDRLLCTIAKHLDSNPDDAPAYTDALDYCEARLKDGDMAYHAMVAALRERLGQSILDCNSSAIVRLDALYKRTLKINAPVDFDSYMLFVEYDREPQKKFYQPRRRVLRSIVEDMQLFSHCCSLFWQVCCFLIIF